MKIIEGIVKGWDEKKKTVQACISSIDVDRDQEIILPSAFAENLPAYMSNPVLLWGHPLGNKEAGPDRLLGKALEILIQEREVLADFQYAVAENEKAELCFNLIMGGYLKAYSIGANGIKFVYDYRNKDHMEQIPGQVRFEVQSKLESGECYLVHTKMELYENSQVFVGSNRLALVKALNKGDIKQKDFDLLAFDRREKSQEDRPPAWFAQETEKLIAKALTAAEDAAKYKRVLEATARLEAVAKNL